MHLSGFHDVDIVIDRVLTGHNGLVHSIQTTKTGMISCDITGLVIERDFWNCVEEGPSLRILKCQSGVNCLTCDAQYIVCGILNKELAIYDRKSLDLVKSLQGHTDHIWSVDMNAKHVVSGSWDGSVKLWQRDTWNLCGTFSHPDSREISGVR